MTTVVGHTRFDAYNSDTNLEIVGEPMAKKFAKNYPPKVVKASAYKLGGEGKPVPVVERTTETVTMPEHTARDKELVTITLTGKELRVPRWMVPYLSGPC